MHKLTVRTTAHSVFVDITREIQRIVSESYVRSGVCHIFVPHTTAGITINENADPDVTRDILQTLERIVPWRGPYAHDEGNSAAHVKAGILGFSQTVLIENGALALGTWQAIYFCEFDGPRNREVWVQIGTAQ
ncbi:MAG TPA: secondary thiamine-phosphate synthase enzyme YjbQ [Candidatus Hydrogenedentes bacterium]|nr:secondary thiamine-phosphate synthase enzyme YjbQ [Candidatus Hydrogenedentota bacterium]